MRVLVTGSTGFIGGACKRVLERQGCEILAPASRELDLHDGSAVRRYLQRARPSHLLHAGWRAVHGDVMHSLENLRWCVASMDLIREFREAGGARATVVGSSAEYNWDGGVCRVGTTPLAPQTVYGAAKNALRVAVHAYARESGLSWAWPRVFFVYGPGENASRLAMHVLRRLAAGEPALLSHGRQVRDYVYIDDVAEGIVAALNSGLQGETDIASGVPVTVRELAGEIGRQLGKPDLLQFGARDAARHDAPVVLGDPEHARSHIGFRVRHTLESGIAKMIAHNAASTSVP